VCYNLFLTSSQALELQPQIHSSCIYRIPAWQSQLLSVSLVYELKLLDFLSRDLLVNALLHGSGDGSRRETSATGH
jgi:hypothetical protein